MTALNGTPMFFQDPARVGETSNGSASYRQSSISSTSPPSLDPSRAPARPTTRPFSTTDSILPPTSLHYSSSSSSRSADLFNSVPEGPSSRYQPVPIPPPIGNHLSDRPRMSSGWADLESTIEDETNQLLAETYPDTNMNSIMRHTATAATAASQDPIVAPQRPPLQSQRRATAPQIPIANHFGGLTLDTAGALNGGEFTAGPAMIQSAYGPQSMGSLSAHPMTMSPQSAVNESSHMQQQQQFYGAQPARRSRVYPPPANPNDMHPPCNTLYVGNLPLDASEAELKSIFQTQRGYKRLSLRHKNNNSMCFVEFSDISSATKALTELYGVSLKCSSRGGIRLSFSKNPFGVRTEQNPQRNPALLAQSNGARPVGSTMHHGSLGATGGYGVATCPPPGLAAPPGLGGRAFTNGGMPPLPPQQQPQRSQLHVGSLGSIGSVGSAGAMSFPAPSQPASRPVNNIASLWPSPDTIGTPSTNYPAYMLGR